VRVIGGGKACLFGFSLIWTLFHLDDVGVLQHFKSVASGRKKDDVPRGNFSGATVLLVGAIEVHASAP
jgi:hypothetical protein